MNKPILCLVAATLVAAANFASAEDAAAGAPAVQTQKSGGKRFDCTKAKDPARCEARRQEMRERLADAKKACAGKEGDDKRACYREAICAKSKDPDKCRDRAEQRAQRYAEMKKACADRQGGELRACMREQFKSRRKDAAK